MRLFFFIIINCFLTGVSNAGIYLQKKQVEPVILQNSDTLITDTAKQDEVIEEIIDNKKLPERDKVQYVSELTRYGFKNLFNKFGYNPSLPYSSQVNPHAESYMQDYLQSHSASLIKMKSWGVPYFNLIDNIFSQYGLPGELKYLAVIESNLNTSATSWVGAGGPWQFMPYTARDLGLVVNNNLDERRDYFKSTHAAAKYLLELYKQMHDWLLVIAAYNGGPQRVYDAIKKSGSKDFWTLQYYLPEESRNHVKKFIATHYIMESGNEGTFLFTPAGGASSYNNKNSLTPEEAAQAETQTISGKYYSGIIAKNIAVDVATFRRYNPDFDNRLSTSGQYDLTLPADKMQLFLSVKYQILNECVQLLLGDSDIPNNKTVYPAAPVKHKNKKH